MRSLIRVPSGQENAAAGHPTQQIRRRPRGQHAGLDEPGERRRHHQNQRRNSLIMAQRQVFVREPEITLDLEPGRVPQPIRGIRHRILRPQLGDPGPEQRRRPGPAQPLGGGHRRELLASPRAIPGLASERVETRSRRLPLVRRRPIHGQRPICRSSGHSDQPDYLPFRMSPRRMQVANLYPII